MPIVEYKDVDLNSEQINDISKENTSVKNNDQNNNAILSKNIQPGETNLHESIKNGSTQQNTSPYIVNDQARNVPSIPNGDVVMASNPVITSKNNNLGFTQDNLSMSKRQSPQQVISQTNFPQQINNQQSRPQIVLPTGTTSNQSFIQSDASIQDVSSKNMLHQPVNLPANSVVNATPVIAKLGE